jgi:cytochrome c553
MAASLLLAPGAAQSQQPPAATLAACTACHGPGGNSQIPLTPSIAGQPRVFIENQLVVIREGLREVPAMKEVLTGVSDETIVELAKYFAAQTPAAKTTTPDATKARQGAEIASALLCGTCHLADYSGQKQVPRLAGQDEAFLLNSMKQFRDDPGPGRDTIMAATLRGLSDADLAKLAHYLSTFKPQ